MNFVFSSLVPVIVFSFQTSFIITIIKFNLDHYQSSSYSSLDLTPPYRYPQGLWAGIDGYGLGKVSKALDAAEAKASALAATVRQPAT